MFWELLNVFHMFFYLWYYFLLVFSADWNRIIYPGKMFCCFSALLLLNNIWHSASGFYVCYINGSEPDPICCFHQTICQPLKLGHTVLLICDVIALGSFQKLNILNIYDKEHFCQILRITKIICGTDYWNKMILNSEGLFKSFVLISRVIRAPVLSISTHHMWSLG